MAGCSDVLGTIMSWNAPSESRMNPRKRAGLQLWRQYQPTITPSPLIAEATVTTAPGTSITVVVSGRAAHAWAAITITARVIPNFTFQLWRFMTILQKFARALWPYRLRQPEATSDKSG